MPLILQSEAQEAIDDKLQTLHLEICELRRQRNSLSLISQLPVELIRNIFLQTVQLAREEIDEPDKRYQDIPALPEGLRLCHICRSWRAIALECKEIWSNMLISHKTSIDPFEFMWAAAGPTTLIQLEMRCDVLPPAMDAIQHKLRNEPARFATYTIFGGIRHMWRMLDGFEAVGFDNLKEVGILQVQTHRIMAPQQTLLTACTAPNLHKISIIGFSIPWNSPLLLSARLTFIVLTHDQLAGSFEDMLSIIKASADNLKHLSLTFDGYNMSSEGWTLAHPNRTSTVPIRLPRLESLVFTQNGLHADDCPAMYAFLRAIRLDPQTLSSFRFLSVRMHDTQEFWSAMGEAFGDVGLTPGELNLNAHLTSSGRHDRIVTMSVWQGLSVEAFARTAAERDAAPAPYLFLCAEQSWLLSRPEAYGAVLSPSNLQILEINGVPDILWTTLGSQTLRELRLGHEEMLELVAFIEERKDFAILPTLQWLVSLKMPNIWREEPRPTRFSKVTMASDAVEAKYVRAVAKALEHRRRVLSQTEATSKDAPGTGTMLDEVVFEGCQYPVGKDALEILEKVARKVDWFTK